MCTMRALVAICACTVLLVTRNSALPYSNTVYDEFLKARYTQSDECPQTFPFMNGRVIYHAMQSTDSTTASFECDEGFQQSNNNTIICLRDAQDDVLRWIALRRPLPSCNLIVCSRDLQPGNNRQIQYNPATGDLLPGSTATYSCEPGYGSADSPKDITCQDDGTWEPPPTFTCEPECPQNVNLTDGTVIYHATPSTQFTTASFRCDEGFQLSHNNNITCDRNIQGEIQWIGSLPSCNLIPCPNPPTPSANQQREITPIDQSGQLLPGSTAEYSCEEDYRSNPDGASPQTIRCLPGGTWEPLQPEFTCIPVTCPNLPSFINGNIRYSGPSLRSPWPIGTTARYECNPGFIQITFERTCQRGGTWSGGRDPVCEPEVLCDPLDGTIPNGFVQPSAATITDNLIVRNAGGVIIGWRVNSVAEYRCNQGYVLKPASGRRFCFRRGLRAVWSSPAPSCEPSRCPELPEKAHLRDEIYGNSYNQVIRTLQLNYKGDVVQQPFAYRTFNGFSLNDTLSVRCVNGWQPLNDQNHVFTGIETCVMRDGKLQWTRTNTCSYTFTRPVYGSDKDVRVNPALNE